MPRARELDVVVYGASGFTGRLVARHLARRHNVRVGLAGRSLARLTEARDEIAAGSPPSFDPPLIAADSSDESLLALAARTRVLISTAGPYSICGTPVVGACAAAGTDYLDINGETPWVHEIVSRFDDMAAERGTLLIPNCGFNTLSDIGTFDAVSRLSEPAQSVRCLVQFHGRLSGGTMATGLHLDTASEHVQAARRNPFLLGGAPAGGARDADADPTSAEYDADLECWTAPFWLAAIDSRVVRRTCGLFREAAEALCADIDGDGGAHLHGFGERLVYRERQLAPDEGVAHNWAAPLPDVARRQRLIERGRLPAPGKGPSEALRSESWFRMFLFAESANRREGVLTSVAGGDPGYDETSKVVAEAALLLATRREELPSHPRAINHGRGGGVLTPAFALGAPMLEALGKAGLPFKEEMVVGEEGRGTVADVARVLREGVAGRPGPRA
jgi:short subunit dehydrogenase-like uncharacterized protein